MQVKNDKTFVVMVKIEKYTFYQCHIKKAFVLLPN